MSDLLTAPERARKIAGRKSAAKLYADLEYELALGEPDRIHEEAGEQALGILDERYPGVKDDSDETVENGHVPNLSRRAGESLGGVESTPEERRERVHQLRQRVHQRRQQNSRTGRPHSGRSRRTPGHVHAPAARHAQTASRIAGHALSSVQAGAAAVAPEPVKELGAFMWEMFLAGVGLSVFYLLVTHPERLTSLTDAFWNTWARLVSKHYDVFPGGGPSPVTRRHAGPVHVVGTATRGIGPGVGQGVVSVPQGASALGAAAALGVGQELAGPNAPAAIPGIDEILAALNLSTSGSPADAGYGLVP